MAIQSKLEGNDIYVALMAIGTIFLAIATIYLAVQYHLYYGLGTLFSGISQI